MKFRFSSTMQAFDIPPLLLEIPEKVGWYKSWGHKMVVGVGVLGLLVSGVIGLQTWLGGVQAATWTVITQRHGVIQNDQNGAVLVEHVARVGERMWVRLQVDTNSGDEAKNTVFKLQYDKGDNGWLDVNSAREIRPAQSGYVGVSQQTGSGGAGACQSGTTAGRGYVVSGQARTRVMEIKPSSCYEVVFVVDTSRAVAGATYRLRLYDVTAQSPLDGYSEYATFSTESGGLSRLSKAKVNSLSTGVEDLKYFLDSQGYDDVATEDAAREILWNVSESGAPEVVLSGGTEDFGASIANVGDVNGDGYDDLLVGASGYNSHQGRAYLYFGGESFSADNRLVFSDGAAESRYGFNVAAAGDVNGDGYADIVISSVATNTSPLKAYIYFGGQEMNVSADVVLSGAAPFPGNAISLGGAIGMGDLNGDGYDDVVLADGMYGGAQFQGRVTVYLGGLSMGSASLTITGAMYEAVGMRIYRVGDLNGDGYDDFAYSVGGISQMSMQIKIHYGGLAMSATPSLQLSPISGEEGFGATAVSTGDMNGDGKLDVAVGAIFGDAMKGSVYLYYGGAGLLTDTPDVTFNNPGVVTGFSVWLDLGTDVNGDGFADLLVAAAEDEVQGKLYTFYGGSVVNTGVDGTITGSSSGGFGLSLAMVDMNGDGFDDVAVSDLKLLKDEPNSGGTVGVYLLSGSLKDAADRYWTKEFTYGYTVGSVGDVNGDGYDDFGIGAYKYDGDRGRVYIYFGGESISDEPSVILEGQSAGDNFGTYVASAGDVNGDGYDDIAIGANYYGTNIGQAFVYLGGKSISTAPLITMTGSTGHYLGRVAASAGDVNGDGFADVLISADAYNGAEGRVYILFGGVTMDGVPDVVLVGAAASSYFGRSAASVGDINGDGYDDVIVGADNYNGGRGAVYLYYGGASMDAVADMVMTGENYSDLFGYDVDGGGDINGDGYPDIVVGAYGYDTNKGKAYIYYGGPGMDAVADLVFVGETASDKFGEAVAIVGDVNGDGYADVLIGARGYDDSHGKVYRYLGGPTTSASSMTTVYSAQGGGYLGASVATAGDINGDGYDDILTSAYSFVPSTSGRSFLAFGGASQQIPVYQLATRANGACSNLTGIVGTWKGKSSMAASSNNLRLQVYRFGDSNAWQTVATNSSLAVNTMGGLTHTISNDIEEYCDKDGWTYWRAYQEKGKQTLETDVFTVRLQGDSQAPEDSQGESTPAMSQITRGGMWFKDGVKQGYSFIKKLKSTPTPTPSPTPEAYAVGDEGPAGGIVFYDKGSFSDGWRYLEAAASDQSSSAEWGCYGKSVPGADSAWVGDGKQNTADILNFHDNAANFNGNAYYTYSYGHFSEIGCDDWNTGGVSAKYARDYSFGDFDDWFLPSKDELNELYMKKDVVGGFTNRYYWSSSEASNEDAWLQSFADGSQERDIKVGVNSVRVIRSF